MASILFSTKSSYQFTRDEIISAVGLFRVIISFFGGIILSFFPYAGIGGLIVTYVVVNILGIGLVRLRFDANDEILDVSSIINSPNKPCLATLFLSWIVSYNILNVFSSFA
jgi:hypothetical protein